MDLCEVEASLVYTVSSMPARDKNETLSLKENIVRFKQVVVAPTCSSCYSEG